MKIKKRNALYLGERDRDIIEYLEPLVTHYDFSSIVRSLIRDGIKYREMTKQNTEGSLSFGLPSSPNVEQSHTPKIDDIQLDKVQVSEDELDELFDSL